MNLYQNINKDKWTKKNILRLLRCSTSNKKSFSNVLTRNKKNFFSVCNSIEWLSFDIKMS